MKNNEEKELQSLRDEILEMTKRLEIADKEKAQAGELGLHLLKEKEQLELTHEALLKEFEVIRSELEKTQQKLTLFRSSQCNAEANELNNEMDEDSAALEARFADKVKTLELAKKHLQEQLIVYKSDSERLQQELILIQTRVEELEIERKTLKEELKELRTREQQLIGENYELEEENVALLKQVSNLRSAQIEFESMKLQIKGMLDEMIILQTSAEEAEKLRSLAEHQVADALATAQHEREHRLALKKEFEQLRNQEHLASLNSLYLGIKGAHEIHDRDTMKQLESSFIADESLNCLKGNEIIKNGNNGGEKDLFSELHGSELTEQLNKFQTENQRLVNLRLEQSKQFTQMLIPFFQKLDIGIVGVNFEEFELTKLKEYMSLAMERLEERIGPQKEAKNMQKRLEKLKESLRKAIILAARKDAWLLNSQQMIVQMGQALYSFYIELIECLQTEEEREENNSHQLNNSSSSINSPPPLLTPLQTSSQSFQSNPSISPPEAPPDPKQQHQNNNRLLNVRSPRITPLMPEICRPIFSKKFLEEISSAQICNNLEENLIDEKLKEENILLKNSFLEEIDLRERLPIEEKNNIQTSFITIIELFKIIKSATEEKLLLNGITLRDKNETEIRQENNKLKELLAVKREQVSSLRSVLRSNKSSTEGAFNCLKEKYESENKIKDETLENLRSQLKLFKEDAATFASHRAMFTARTEDLQQQLESAQNLLKTADEEKKTLNQLLRMSIQQKLMITQRMEELEMTAERQYQQRTPTSTDPHHHHHQPPTLKRGGMSSGTSRSGGGGGQGGGGGGGMTRTVRYPGPSTTNQQNGGINRGKQ
uniref:Protein bicaudal D n=1 Tax=Meloidogyne floridensis TaxID=298350 RepID=A0A915P393_9BILA